MFSGRFCLWLLLLGGAFLPAAPRAATLFNQDNFPGVWTFTTNAAGTIFATETAVHRRGREVYCRVLSLQAVPPELSPVNPNAAAEAAIRRFIAAYRPPPIPYTSEHTAQMTGREKFNCLEFAEDLVKQATANGIPAQVIGITFKGEWVGHAVAGFPTAEGRTLYFDSTPGAGQISLSAHEARVEVGEPYRRAGGGELSVVGERPITEIIPVTKLSKLAESLAEDAAGNPAPGYWAVTNIQRVPAADIDYAATNSLEISDDQVARWKAAAAAVLAAQSQQQNESSFAAQSVASRAAAQALKENEKLAAQNDPYGQLRMGERYLRGDGVPKNPVLGRAYLRQAADQENPTAMEELKNLVEETTKNSG
jgi:TPR repeat protein